MTDLIPLPHERDDLLKQMPEGIARKVRPLFAKFEEWERLLEGRDLADALHSAGYDYD